MLGKRMFMRRIGGIKINQKEKICISNFYFLEINLLHVFIYRYVSI